MSSQEESEQEQQEESSNQVDFIPDSDKEPEEFVPKVTCKKCIHNKTCYFLTILDQAAQSFKASKILELPYDINVLAQKCSAFDDGRSVGEKMTEDDNLEEPHDVEVVDG